TGRERVAVCGYHGWQDWYIGTTSRRAGVPKAVCGLSHPFAYNDFDALDRLLSSHRGEFAAVIMEPVNFYWPSEGYLEGVKRLTHAQGSVLIFDEICTGFHLGLGGAQKLFGVTPDLATFGKAIGNGYPISCIVGRRDVMRTFEDVFVSFTFAGDVAAMAAALTVLDILEHTDAYARMESAGRRLADGAKALAEEAGLGGRLTAAEARRWRHDEHQTRCSGSAGGTARATRHRAGALCPLRPSGNLRDNRVRRPGRLQRLSSEGIQGRAHRLDRPEASARRAGGEPPRPIPVRLHHSFLGGEGLDVH